MSNIANWIKEFFLQQNDKTLIGLNQLRGYKTRNCETKTTKQTKKIRISELIRGES